MNTDKAPNFISICGGHSVPFLVLSFEFFVLPFNLEVFMVIYLLSSSKAIVSLSLTNNEPLLH